MSSAEKGLPEKVQKVLCDKDWVGGIGASQSSHQGSACRDWKVVRLAAPAVQPLLQTRQLVCPTGHKKAGTRAWVPQTPATGVFYLRRAWPDGTLWQSHWGPYKGRNPTNPTLTVFIITPQVGGPWFTNRLAGSRHLFLIIMKETGILVAFLC